jgi:hypothetical protein
MGLTPSPSTPVLQALADWDPNDKAKLIKKFERKAARDEVRSQRESDLDNEHSRLAMHLFRTDQASSENMASHVPITIFPRERFENVQGTPGVLDNVSSTCLCLERLPTLKVPRHVFELLQRKNV